MPSLLAATPLIALQAVALDTETTGLDPASARVIEIGGLRLDRGRIDRERPFRTFVAGGPIPAAATRVHGIRDADLAGALPFPEAYRAWLAFAGERPLIGHSLGFDLALFQAECGRAGLPFQVPPFLDVALLAQRVAPSLPDFSLEVTARWLGLPLNDRHRALGDAEAAAAVFLALVPRLRAKGIHTFAEAQASCRALAEARGPELRSAFIEPGPDLVEADRQGIARRLDSYPYRHRVQDVMSRPPAFVAAEMPVAAALERMIEGRVSSLFVGNPGGPAAETGIVTERDLLRGLKERGAAVLSEPAGALASRPLITVPAEAFLYRAIGRMRARSIRHLGVTDMAGRLVGALSARDLLRQRADSAIALGDDIDRAEDVPALSAAWAKVPAMAAALLGEEVSPASIAGVIARELGALTRRAGDLAEAAMMEEGMGPAPCCAALLILGSAGRGESLLALDQDHALVFAEGEPDGPADRWFAAFGERVSAILQAVGVPLCPGGVMAGNAPFRGSLATWLDRVRLWTERARPEDLLNVDITFDMRPVRGDGALAEELRQAALAAARRSRPFLRLLQQAGATGDSPFGLFGRLKAEEGSIDLKRFGLRPLVSAARLLALAHGVAARGTAERLEGVIALEVGGRADLEAALAVRERLLGLILREQLADIAAGRKASNRVPLSLVRQQGGLGALRHDLRHVAALEALTADLVSTDEPDGLQR